MMNFQTVMAAAESAVTDEESIGGKLAGVFTDGGIFMWLIIATSITLMAVISYKLTTLNRAKVMPGSLCDIINEFSDEPSESGAEKLQNYLNADSSILAKICKTALARQEEGRAEVEKIVEIKARESIVKVSSGLSIIDVIITIAPLLGLLGTASGLVGVFSSLDGEVTDHTALAKGISEALYTTIAGLAVAVPGVIAQSHFSRNIETMAADLELLMSRFIASTTE